MTRDNSTMTRHSKEGPQWISLVISTSCSIVGVVHEFGRFQNCFMVRFSRKYAIRYAIRPARDSL